MPGEQWSLDGEPPARHHPNNLPRRLVDGDGVVIKAVWLGMCASGQPVGDCRKCGGSIYPLRPVGVSANRTDYMAECRDADCNANDVAFPNGRTGRWDNEQGRGRKRRLPPGTVSIRPGAKVGQSEDD